jgi:hypothetical protein
MSRARAFLALAAMAAAIGSVPEPKHTGNRDAFGGRTRTNRGRRLSRKEYEMLELHRWNLRTAPGSQAMHRMRREAEWSGGSR